MRPCQFVPVLFTALLICSCGKRKHNNPSINAPADLTAATYSDNVYGESFERFNERFHNDSTFQISRVEFPIGGKYVDDLVSRVWSADNWEILITPVSAITDTTHYKHSLVRTDTFVTEKFWIEQSGFKVERRFEKKGGKWYLVYYDDINL
jgi:hypothetical protein